MAKSTRGEPSTQPLRAAVLGSPIAHSKSPALHRAAYAAAGLPWRYDAFEVSEPDLEHFLSALGPRWVGLSLTMPLKEVVLDLVDDVDAKAERTQVANTVVLPGSPGSSGRAVAYNTDIQGIVEAVMTSGLKAIDSAEIIGSGATARSALAAVAELGASRVVLRARDAQARHLLAELAHDWGFTDVVTTAMDGSPTVGECDLTVSTLPAGAADALADTLMPECGTLLDVVYDPWPTPLAAAWQGTVISGLEMLLYQAAEQVRLMAGVEPDVQAMRAAVGLEG